MNVGASVNASSGGGGGRSSGRSKHQGQVDLVVSKFVCPFVIRDLDVQLHLKLKMHIFLKQVVSIS